MGKTYKDKKSKQDFKALNRKKKDKDKDNSSKPKEKYKDWKRSPN